VGVVGSCRASRDGVRGHERAGSGGPRPAKALVLTERVEWESLALAGRAEMVSAAMSELGHLGAETQANALLLKRGVEWELLDPAGRPEMVSAAMSELSHLAPEASAKGWALKSGVDWGSLSPSARDGLKREVRSGRTLRGHAKKRTAATEACAWKIAQTEGKDWDTMWTLTQESYRDGAETVCHNCYVGGS